MKGIVSNPNIAPHVKESVLAYQDAGLLAKFYTTFINHKNNPLSRTLSFIFPNFIREFKRRSFEEISYQLVKTKPYSELIRVFAARKLGLGLTDEIWERNELKFDKWVARHLKEDLDFIHVTEHASLSTIKRAKNLNITSFYEQPSIHHQAFSKIIKEQLERYPEFVTDTIVLLHNAASARRNQRRNEELNEADFIICNSSFTKKTLVNAGIEERKILTIPLGFPQPEVKTIANKKDRNLKFIAAGNLSLGKGTHILLEAWKDFHLIQKDAELWLIGKNNLPKIFTRQLPKNIKFFGNIPRLDLMKKFSEANVLIHPTLADGFGMVITEAMSCGLPVITTMNSAGPDIIENGKSGLLIEANNKTAILESLLWCLDNKVQLTEMGNEALKKANSYLWADYRKNLVNQLRDRLK